MPKVISFIEAKNEYQGHLIARGLSRSTIKNHIQVLNTAQHEWGDIRITSITGSHVDRLFRRAEWIESTRNLYLGTLRSFFQWCRRENYMARDFDPTAGWHNLKVPRRDKMRLPLDEFPALLDACVHPRDRMICALGIYTFLRGGEIATLQVSALNLDRHELNVYRHKTREEDVLPVSLELASEFERYFKWYRQNVNSPHLRH